ncbi:MAG: nucleoside deaminase [Clostridia bacterium]|nr:nucleoside deaminase [Clostridia bacterium]
MKDYYNDIPFMKLALEQAHLALGSGDVPVGAVMVKDGKVIATGYNRREADGNALAHAECEAIQKACRILGSWRLHDCTLYVTLEPCPMCAGAIVNARIKRVVYGAKDPVAGCVGSKIQLFAMDFNHTPTVTTGILEKECADLLADFFKDKR